MRTRFQRNDSLHTLVLLQPDCTGGEGPLLDQDGQPINFLYEIGALPPRHLNAKLRRIRNVSMKLTAYCKQKQLGRRAHLYP